MLKPAPGMTMVAVAAPVAAQAYYIDRQNRIEVLRRIGQLQQPDAHWEWSPELEELLRQWSGGAAMADAHPSTVTRAAIACATGIIQYVWAAQREHREHTALTAAEMLSLQGMNWDLAWAQMGVDRAAGWLTRYS